MKLVHTRASVSLTFVDEAEENMWIVTIEQDDPQGPERTRYSSPSEFDQWMMDEIAQKVHDIRNDIDLVPLLKSIEDHKGF